MKWSPIIPIQSSLTPRIDINDYGTDMKFDFFAGDLVTEQGDIAVVEGFDNFEQRLKIVLLTPATAPLSTWGLRHLLPSSTTQDEFNQECELLGRGIVQHQYCDSTPNNPNGLGYTVEEVICITSKVIDNLNCLLISVKITGSNDQVDIIVPVFPLEDLEK